MSVSASDADIKNAFRRLVMIFHPDRNPNGKDDFELVVKAYETLSDPVKKRAYDLRIASPPAASATGASAPGQKKWSFDEREMKRRQYYNEHIKKYEKATAGYSAIENKRNYNEFKYILFATPLAVVLFLLIMSLAGSKLPPADMATGSLGPSITSVSATESSISGVAAPFGRPHYASGAGRELTVKNETGDNIELLIFDGERFVRSVYIRSYFFARVLRLPVSELQLRWAAESSDGNDQYKYFSIQKPVGKEQSELTLTGGQVISQEDFYKNSRK